MIEEDHWTGVRTSKFVQVCETCRKNIAPFAPGNKSGTRWQKAWYCAARRAWECPECHEQTTRIQSARAAMGDLFRRASRKGSTAVDITFDRWGTMIGGLRKFAEAFYAGPEELSKLSVAVDDTGPESPAQTATATEEGR